MNPTKGLPFVYWKDKTAFANKFAIASQRKKRLLKNSALANLRRGV